MRKVFLLCVFFLAAVVQAEPVKPITIQYIYINISCQILDAYWWDDNGRLHHRWFRISGARGINVNGTQEPKEIHNHLGLFRVEEKDEDHWSQAFDSPMHFAMFFHQGHAIHATTRDNYRYLGQPASHGCIRMKREDAQWLFQHTPLGTPVFIYHSVSF